MQTEKTLNLLLPKGTIQSETLETFQRAGYDIDGYKSTDRSYRQTSQTKTLFRLRFQDHKRYLSMLGKMIFMIWELRVKIGLKKPMLMLRRFYHWITDSSALFSLLEKNDQTSIPLWIW